MTRRTAVTVFLLLFAVPLTFAQMGRGGGRGKGARNYDKASEITVKGIVGDVTHPAGQKGGGAGTHLTLRSDQGTFDVHVGPSSYISSQKFAFAKGDAIEVVGSKVKVNGQDALLARQITKEGEVLSLRNEDGLPLWSQAAPAPK